MKIIIDNKKEFQAKTPLSTSIIALTIMIFIIYWCIELMPLIIYGPNPMWIPILLLFIPLLSLPVTITPVLQSFTDLKINIREGFIRKGSKIIHLDNNFKANYKILGNYMRISMGGITLQNKNNRIKLITTTKKIIRIKDFIEKNTNIDIKEDTAIF